MPRVGAHLSIAGGLPRAVDRAEATGCEALQIFTKSVGQWRARPLPDREIDDFKRRVAATHIAPVVAHTSYLINVAADDPALRRRSRTALAQELDRAEVLELDGLVMHPGSARREADGLAAIADAVGELIAARPDGRTRILLEHTAGQGTNLGHRFEHLSAILDRLGKTPRVGVCLDTCHLSAAGYDISSEKGYERTFDDFAAIVGLQRLALFHLNDSKRPCGSRVDRHEHIGRGCIGLEGFRRLLTDERFRAVPMLLETPKTDPWKPRALVDPLDRMNLRTVRRLLESHGGNRRRIPDPGSRIPNPGS